MQTTMRPIDANALNTRIQAWKERLKGYYGENDDMVITLDKVQNQIIKNMPVIDAVQVVRRKDCKYAMHASETGKVLGCKNFKWKSRGLRTENDYCSYGERKDGKEKDDADS